MRLLWLNSGFRPKARRMETGGRAGRLWGRVMHSLRRFAGSLGASFFLSKLLKLRFATHKQRVPKKEKQVVGFIDFGPPTSLTS